MREFQKKIMRLMQPRNARQLNEMVCHRKKQQVIQNYSADLGKRCMLRI